MSDNPERPPDSTLTKLRWPITLVLLALIAAGAFMIFLRGLRNVAVDTVNATGHQVSSVLDRFSQGSITRTFEESLPSLSSEPGGRLELAALTVTENISESNNLTTAWGGLNLGSTVTEIKVPATYRYYLRLHDPWKLEISNAVCIVHAPRIHPTLPPAIDTSRMEKKTEEGWGRFNATAQMDALERDITPTLAAFASDTNHLAIVREECRKTVGQFVRDWLFRQEQWRADRFTSIKIVFPDEKPDEALTLPPTIELKLE